jgi:hypothetical protein
MSGVALSVSAAVPASLSFIPGRFEVEEGQDIALAVVAYDAAGNAFDMCTCLNDTAVWHVVEIDGALAERSSAPSSVRRLHAWTFPAARVVSVYRMSCAGLLCALFPWAVKGPRTCAGACMCARCSGSNLFVTCSRVVLGDLR